MSNAAYVMGSPEHWVALSILVRGTACTLERRCQRDVQRCLTPVRCPQQAFFLQGWCDQLEAQRHTGLTQSDGQRDRWYPGVGPGRLKAGITRRAQVGWCRGRGRGCHQDIHIMEHL